MYRLWIGATEKTLQRGAIYATLKEAIDRGHQFADAYAVRIEIGQGEWHVFPQTQDTILGPGFSKQTEPALPAPEPSARQLAVPVGESPSRERTPPTDEASASAHLPPVAEAEAARAPPPALDDANLLNATPRIDLPVSLPPPLADYDLREPESSREPPAEEPSIEPLPIEDPPQTVELEAEEPPLPDDGPMVPREPFPDDEPMVPREPLFPEQGPAPIDPPPPRRKAPLTLDEWLPDPPSVQPAPRAPASARPPTRALPTKRSPPRRSTPLVEEPQPERRAARRVFSPMPAAQPHTITWDRREVRLVNVSWTGARISTKPHRPPHAGEIIVVEVQAFGLVAHLAGQVRWVREGECGLAFDEALMTKHSTVLLERLLGPP